MPDSPTPPDWLTIPSPATLKKYGLDKHDYLTIAERQNYCCPICENELRKRSNIDHFHVKNWKKMPPEVRKLYVRGVTCWVCNHYYLGRAITVQKAQNVLKYLEEFEKRRPK